MGFYGTYGTVPMSLGFVTYWLKGCDPTYSGIETNEESNETPVIITKPI